MSHATDDWTSSSEVRTGYRLVQGCTMYSTCINYKARWESAARRGTAGSGSTVAAESLYFAEDTTSASPLRWLSCHHLSDTAASLFALRSTSVGVHPTPPHQLGLLKLIWIKRTAGTNTVLIKTIQWAYTGSKLTAVTDFKVDTFRKDLRYNIPNKNEIARWRQHTVLKPAKPLFYGQRTFRHFLSHTEQIMS